MVRAPSSEGVALTVIAVVSLAVFSSSSSGESGAFNGRPLTASR